MSSKKNDDLFVLIHSLTKGEKKQFRIYARQNMRGESSNYLLLFDIYDSLSEYDQKKIEARAAAADLTRQLSSLRSKLQNVILRHIRQSHTESRKQQFLELMSFSDILSRKGMFNLQWTILEKAAEIADEMNWYGMQWQVNRELYSLTFRMTEENVQKLYDERERKDEKMSRALFMADADSEFLRISSLLIDTIIMNSEASEEHRRAVADDVHSFLNKHAQNPEMGFYTEYISAFVALEKPNNHREALNHFRNTRAKLEERPLAITDAPWIWFFLSREILNIISILKNTHEMESELKHIRNFSTTHLLEIQPLLVNFELLRYDILFSITNCLARREYKRAVEEVDKIILEHKNTISSFHPEMQVNFWINAACIYFIDTDYQNVLRCLANIDDRHDSSLYFLEKKYFAILISIAAHYELQNYDTIMSISRSMLRKPASHFSTIPFAKAFLNFARHELTDECPPENFRKFRDESIQLIDNETRIRNFNFEAWLEAHIRGIPFSLALSDVTISS